MSPPNTKPKNLYIVGAQCTGKTTIVKGLEHFFKELAANTGTITPPRIITEVARSVLREIDFKTADIRNSPTLSFELQKRILRKQYDVEKESDDGWIISDRSAVDPVMYARHHVGEDAVQAMLNTPEWSWLEQRMRDAVVVVCEAGTTWLTDDGVRLMPEDMGDWMDFHNSFCGFLEEREIPFVVLKNSVTSIESRVEFTVNAWQSGNIPVRSEETLE